MFRFSGAAPAGQYFIYLMAEDLIPVPRMSYFTNNTPLSAVPMHLSLTGEPINHFFVHIPVLSTGELAPLLVV